MTSLMLHEKRGHLTHINAIGELCAQFRKGILAVMRGLGADKSIKLVEAYHKLHPEAAKKAWYPDVFDKIEDATIVLYAQEKYDYTFKVLDMLKRGSK